MQHIHFLKWIFFTYKKSSLANPSYKTHLVIFFQIARRLLGKILIDLRNTREEAISIAELKSNQETTELPSIAREDSADLQKSQINPEHVSKASLGSEKSVDLDDDDDKEPKYRLDPK